LSGGRLLVKKILLMVPALAAAALLVGFAYAAYTAQRADLGWSPAISRPTYRDTHPLVVIDEGHHNASTASMLGRYRPFAQLLKADGYAVRTGKEAFSPGSLEGVQVLVSANASGASKPQFLGINVSIGASGDRAAPAFTPGEVRAVSAWVKQGGSLLLIADHAPFGTAVEGLANEFGIKMYKGFLEVPNEISDPLMFSRENGRLGEHPILSGDAPETAIRRVMTFTGQSLDGPPEANILLRVPANAIEYLIQEGQEARPGPAGKAQGLAMTWGQGRIVVLGEAAMLTAQVANNKPFGMNLPGNDNKQFALNAMHWLTRKF